MKRFIYLLFLALIHVPAFGRAQGVYALPFLAYEASPQLAGMGGALVGLPNNDLLAVDYNPAQIAHNRYLTSAYSKVKFLPAYGDVYLSEGGAGFGYDLARPFPNLPLSIGAGFTQRFLYLGKNLWTDEYGNELGEFESKEWYTGYHLGIRFARVVNISVGYSAKRYFSRLTPVEIDAEAENPDGWAHDVGALVEWPLANFLPPVLYRSADGQSALIPALTLSVGGALVNLGHAVRYIKKEQSDPLPRQARLGIGVTGSLTLKSGDFSLRLLRFSYASQAEDYLPEYHTDGTFSYQSFPGEINIFENILLNRSNEQVQHRRGFTVEIGELFSYHWGLKSDDLRRDTHTSAMTVKARGILKSAAFLLNQPGLKRVLNHVDLQYQQAVITLNYGAQRKYHGFSLLVLR